ncbi:MAG TPA: hypothetical protein VIV60_27400 [Polyangiaceae bacterium]
MNPCLGIEDRRARIPQDIIGNDGVLGVSKDPAELAVIDQLCASIGGGTSNPRGDISWYPLLRS